MRIGLLLWFILLPFSFKHLSYFFGTTVWWYPISSTSLVNRKNYVMYLYNPTVQFWIGILRNNCSMISRFHWLNIYGNSKIILCGIHFNKHYQLPHCFSCRCCEKNPEKRASSDELLKHPFLQQRNMASKEWLADYVKQTKETPTLQQWWQDYTPTRPRTDKRMHNKYSIKFVIYFRNGCNTNFYCSFFEFLSKECFI